MEQSGISPHNEYWDGFYSGNGLNALMRPSQFAAFIVNEVPDAKTMLEFGCGTGRDSLFFASQGLAVTALDASHSAIDKCRVNAGAANLRNIRFHRQDVADASQAQWLVSSKFDLIYARFFLHAIDEPTQAAMLDLCARVISDNGRLALEFRTPKDASLPKATPAHYRRFVEPDDLISEARQRRFTLSYFTEGRGFAKYKDDDAYVARCVFDVGVL